MKVKKIKVLSAAILHGSLSVKIYFVWNGNPDHHVTPAYQCKLMKHIVVQVPIVVHLWPGCVVRGPWFRTQSGNILSFLLPLFQKGQLSVTGESMCTTKYWLTA